MTVHEVSRLTGVSIRALQYYDRIGLLRPAARSEAGYRLYDGSDLERLQQILLFRELEFPLQDIRRILENPAFDRVQALDEQIELLRLKKEHLENLIRLACEIRATGGRSMDFSAFDTQKLDAYAQQAKTRWGATEAYREYEQKAKGRSREDDQALADEMMQIFAAFGALKDGSPAAPEAQALVTRLQAFITAHYYTCTDEILAGLGRMYEAGGEMTDNIARSGGAGTAAFASAAIQAHCEKEA